MRFVQFLFFRHALARDLKKDMYALIHAKSLCGRNYIIGKMIAGVGFVYAVIIPLTFIINMIAMRVGKSYGFRVDFWDIWKRVIILDFPSILLTGCLMMFIALLFRSIMPAIPALLLYFLACENIYGGFSHKKAGKEQRDRATVLCGEQP